MPKSNRESKDSLFSNLTRLFKSGPIVRRKVRSFDTVTALPDKTKSSGMLLFQKSQSPTYSSITANAYNLTERLMRYQDFVEMLYTAELSCALNVYCLSSDTVIPLLDGTKKTVKDLFESGRTKFGVYSFDIENEKFVPGVCERVIKTGVNQEIFRVTLDDGSFLRLTENHLVLLSDGTYCRVKDLKTGSSVRSLYTRISSKEISCCNIYGYEQILSPNGWIYTHRMVAENSNPGVKGIVHHVDFNKRNNESSNLRFMSRKEHQQLHNSTLSLRWKTDLEYVEKMRKSSSEHAKKLHAQPGWTKEFLRRRNEVFASYDAETRKRIFGHPGPRPGTNAGEKNGRWNKDFVRSFSKEQIIEWILSGKTIRDVIKELPTNSECLYSSMKRAGIKKWHIHGIVDIDLVIQKFHQWICVQSSDLNLKRNFLKACEFSGVDRKLAYFVLTQRGYKNWGDFLDRTNHLVLSVVSDGFDDVYDLQVEEWHNFAISGSSDSESYVIVHNSSEATPQDEKGRVLHIFSNDKRIKSLLEDLFYGTLNFEFNAGPWVRSLCQFGDEFLYNDVSPQYGVINAFPIPVNEIEREENYDLEDPFAFRFRWVTLGQRVLENWEVTHMRLLGNDAFLPYGSSVLEGARRIWRQLILIEDAMLVYRIVRAPERRVFYIDVGGMPTAEIPAYMEQAKSQLRHSPVTDKNTGRVDMRFNPLPVHWDSKIPLLDGRTISIKQVSDELKEGKDVWVYSIQDGTKALVPGKVTWCDKNYTAKKLVRVWLDNDSSITTAPEHPFVMRDGSSKRADELRQNDSLMPLYRRKSTNGYEECYDPRSEEYVLTHKFVAKDVYREECRSTRYPVVHHKNPSLAEKNKLNNRPDNLQVMSFWDHKRWHQEQIKLSLLRPDVLAENAKRITEYNKSEKKRERTSRLNVEKNSVAAMSWYNGSELHKKHDVIRSESMKKMWDDPERRQSAIDKMTLKWTQECQDRVVEIVKSMDKFVAFHKFLEDLKNDREFLSAYTKANETSGRNVMTSFHRHFMGKLILKSYKNWKSLWFEHNPDALTPKVRASVLKNHKVKSVEFLDVSGEDVYCMTVVGPDGQDDRHNFAVCGQSDSSRVFEDGVIVMNSVDEDYWIPRRGPETGTEIKTLEGGQNIAAVEDVKYIQQKMVAATGIPKPYLGFEETLSSRGSLAQLDVRFSRTINTIQRTVVSELNKLGIIHLFCHGYRNDDLVNFTLRLSNPSTVAQQQKLELVRARFDIAGNVPENIVDRRYVQTEVLGLTDDDIERIEDGLIEDAKFRVKLENVGSEQPSSGGGGGGGGSSLFGGGGEEELSGEEEPELGGGGEEEAPEEPAETSPEELEAGNVPDEDEPESELLLSVDVPDGRPIRPDSSSRNAYNRSRRSTARRDGVKGPDLKRTLDPSHDDPFDLNFSRAFAKMSTSESKRAPVTLTKDVESCLRRMESKFSGAPGRVIVESFDAQDSVDSAKSSDVLELDIVDDGDESDVVGSWSSRD